LFVRIEHIIFRSNEVLALCVELKKQRNAADDPCLSSEFRRYLSDKCECFVVQEGRKRIFPGFVFKQHLVVVSVGELLYAIPVLDHFEI